MKDGEGNIISQNMPKEFEDMIDLIFQEAKEKSKKQEKWSITLHIKIGSYILSYTNWLAYNCACC